MNPTNSRIDTFLIGQHEKHKHNKFTRFVYSRNGFILATLLVMYQAIDQTFVTWQEGQFIMTIMLVLSCLLLLVFSIKHTILHQRIEHLEYRLKFLEIAILLYAGYEACMRIGLTEGYLSIKMIAFALCTILMGIGYAVQSRFFFLKSKDIIQHS